MDSYNQQVEFDSAGSQQTRLSGFFKNVHSKFAGLLPLSKKDPVVEDVIITSQVVRKKPPLLIGNFTDKVAPPEAKCRNQSASPNVLPTPPLGATVGSNENVIDSKKGIAIIEVVQPGKKDSILSKQSSENTVADHSNGDAFKQPNAGAGTKRKTSELEDVMNKRIDTRMLEVSFPTSNSNAFRNTKPAVRKAPDHSILRGSDEEIIKAKVSVKKVTWEQDSDWIHEPSPAPAFTILESHKESNKVESAKDAIVQQNRNRLQSPPPATSILPSDNSLQDDPLRQIKEVRVDTDAEKISNKGLSNNSSTEFSNPADEIDSEKCTTSGRRQRKEVFLGDNWSLPVDLKGDLFSTKLKEILSIPYDYKESSEMWDLATRRKPVLKLRQTRGRTMHVPSEDEGLSYLDHHPDLAQRLKESSHPSEKLALLRAFFFWLQHSCMEGAYKPWAPASKNSTQEGDCVFTDGPDCEVLAVVLPLDEKNEVSTVVKPLDPVTIDLSDDDEDDCLEVSVKLPVKAVPKQDYCQNFQKAATCICCFKEFGMEKDQQRSLYKICGHIETCMKCVDKLWSVGKQGCLRCGVIQSVKPRSILDFADSAD